MKIGFHPSFAALALLVLSTLHLQLTPANAQGTPEGTPFLYRGHLFMGGAPADGTYDLAITLFETNQGGVVIAGPVLNSAVKVTHGLYHVTLDFGPGPFTGTNYWLDISARPTGSNAFTALSSRLRLKPTPFAHGPPRLMTTVLRPHEAGQAFQVPLQSSGPATAHTQPSAAHLPPAPKPAPSQNQ